tara:strand:+ start:938 stop:1105 length:168 start_codon:yes stop_codon:yes gene_type:complete
LQHTYALYIAVDTGDTVTHFGKTDGRDQSNVPTAYDAYLHIVLSFDYQPDFAIIA